MVWSITSFQCAIFNADEYILTANELIKIVVDFTHNSHVYTKHPRK